MIKFVTHGIHHRSKVWSW